MAQEKRPEDGKPEAILTALNPSMSCDQRLESLLKGLMNSGVPITGGKEKLKELQRQKKQIKSSDND